MTLQPTRHTVGHTTKNAMRALTERATQTIPSAQQASAKDTVGHRSPGSMNSRHNRHQPPHLHTDREAHGSHTDRVGFMQAAARQRLIQFHAGFDTSEAGSAGGITDAPHKHADSPHEQRTCTPTPAVAAVRRSRPAREHRSSRSSEWSVSASFCSSSCLPATVLIDIERYEYLHGAAPRVSATQR